MRRLIDSIQALLIVARAYGSLFRLRDTILLVARKATTAGALPFERHLLLFLLRRNTFQRVDFVFIIDGAGRVSMILQRQDIRNGVLEAATMSNRCHRNRPNAHG